MIDKLIKLSGSQTYFLKYTNHTICLTFQHYTQHMFYILQYTELPFTEIKAHFVPVNSFAATRRSIQLNKHSTNDLEIDQKQNRPFTVTDSRPYNQNGTTTIMIDFSLFNQKNKPQSTSPADTVPQH